MKLPPLSIGRSQYSVVSDPDTETVRFRGSPGVRVAIVVVVVVVVVGDGGSFRGSTKRSRFGVFERI